MRVNIVFLIYWLPLADQSWREHPASAKGIRESEIIYFALTGFRCFRQQHGLLPTVSVSNLDWGSLFDFFGEFMHSGSSVVSYLSIDF